MVSSPVTFQTLETEDPSHDGEYKLEFFTTECLNYQHQEMYTHQRFMVVGSWVCARNFSFLSYDNFPRQLCIDKQKFLIAAFPLLFPKLLYCNLNRYISISELWILTKVSYFLMA